MKQAADWRNACALRGVFGTGPHMQGSQVKPRGHEESIWQLSPWGPPGFYLIEGAGVHGALQKRREPLPSGRKGYECSFAVFDIDASSKIIEAAGGRLLGPTHAIPTICELRQFADTEDNEAIICQYAPERLKEMGLA